MELETKLKQFWKEATEAEKLFSKLEGEKESILRRLKDEDGLDGAEGAKGYVKSQEREKEKLNGELDMVLRTLKENFGFE